MNPLRQIGMMMMLTGAAAAAAFMLGFDTSAEVPTQTIMGQTIGGQRVENIGRLNMQQNGVILSGFWSLIGAVLFTARHDQASQATAAQKVRGGIQCPRCRRISPEGATTCDCGYRLDG